MKLPSLVWSEPVRCTPADASHLDPAEPWHDAHPVFIAVNPALPGRGRHIHGDSTRHSWRQPRSHPGESGHQLAAALVARATSSCIYLYHTGQPQLPFPRWKGTSTIFPDLCGRATLESKVCVARQLFLQSEFIHKLIHYVLKFPLSTSLYYSILSTGTWPVTDKTPDRKQLEGGFGSQVRGCSPLW